MSPPPEISVGVVGLGMGSSHARQIADGNVPGLRLAAIADASPERLRGFDGIESIKAFTDGAELIARSGVQAVIIATPHYSHTDLGIRALKAGLHVLVEKPTSVHKADCERLIAARRDTVFAAVFNQRTDPLFKKIRDLVRGSELGDIRRVNWIVSDWFRTEAYYKSGGWRATWAGEGGGVLLNQCPHNLDLLQWIFGMPARVRAFCGFGRYHRIEVEDDVTAYLEFPNGATGVFVTSTGEAPGTNRLEVTGERGRLVLEGGELKWTRNETPMSQFSRETPEGFATPANWEVRFPISTAGGQHLEILRNFAEAIAKGAPLIAPAEEGIHSVELANAIIYSSVSGKTVELPLDGAAYARTLRKLILQSK